MSAFIRWIDRFFEGLMKTILLGLIAIALISMIYTCCITDWTDDPDYRGQTQLLHHLPA